MSESSPFGNPDGSRSDIHELMDGFVSFDAASYGNGLGLSAKDLSVRVFVGAKGSGKTVYLRRMQATAENEPSVYTDILQQDVPLTRLLVGFCERYTGRELTEHLMQLWYCAIIRSLISHVLYADRIKSDLSADDRAALDSIDAHLVPKTRTPVSCYSQVTHILNSYNTAHAFSRYFSDARWPEVEYILSRILQHTPPVYFFIDSVDEEYEHSPMHWMRCQEALFLRVMRFVRDARLGGRLHVVITIREQVLASVYRSENRTKYRGEPHIRVLDWNYEAIRHLLDQKIARLDDRHLVQPGHDHPFCRWLGHHEIPNVRRNCIEDIGSYILRHSRRVPRDIVAMGNRLSLLVAAAKVQGQSAISPAQIRSCISDEARHIAQEQITVCANQIASSLMPAGAVRNDYASLYTGDTEYIRHLAERLGHLIKEVGKDRFTREEFHHAQLTAKEAFGESSDVLTVLWQNGLLGYTREGPNDVDEEVFFSEEELGDFHLPVDRAKYLFHSCLIDGLGILPVGSSPVLGSVACRPMEM